MTQVDTPTAPDAPERPRPRARLATAISLGFLALVFLLPLRGLFRSQGPPMEEGFMLTFPMRVLHGDLPNRDFLHLYGPGSLWTLAAVFKAFGVSLWTERAVGLVQQVALVLAVFALSRHWGRIAAVFAAAISAVIIIPPIGLTALAWVGAVAFGLWGVVVGLEAVRATDPARTRRLALISGVLFGLGLLYRPDLIIATTLAGAVLVGAFDGNVRRRFLGGIGIGLAPYVVHLATAGVGNAIKGMILDPVVYLRGGRRLPVPPRPGHVAGFLQRAGELHDYGWPFPALSTAAQLTCYFFLLLGAVALVLVAGVRAQRRERHGAAAMALFTGGLFGAGMLPQALQRTDSTHFAWVACVPMGLAVPALVDLLRDRRKEDWCLPSRGVQLAAGAAVLAVLVTVIPFFTARNYSDYSAQSFGIHRESFKIQDGSRVFYYGRNDVATALNALLPDADRLTKPGQRLFVGQRDLRKTPYSDAFLYYMLPKLRPSTYFIEMDPGVANRKGSRLAQDVADADILILTNVWQNWDEPNDSRKVGPDEPNEVVRRQFCLYKSYGDLYDLYQRCH